MLLAAVGVRIRGTLQNIWDLGVCFEVQYIRVQGLGFRVGSDK